MAVGPEDDDPYVTRARHKPCAREQAPLCGWSWPFPATGIRYGAGARCRPLPGSRGVAAGAHVYHDEQSQSVDCTLTEVVSAKWTPMLDTSPMMEYDQQPLPVTAAVKKRKVSALWALLTAPTVDTSHVLAKESPAAGTSSDGYAGTTSKLGTATKSVVLPKSDAGDRNQPQDKPGEYFPEQLEEQVLQCGAPCAGEQAKSPAAPIMSRQKRERRLSCKDVQEIELAQDEVKMELGSSRGLLVSGNQTRPTAEPTDQVKEQHVSKGAQIRRARRASGASSEKSTFASTRHKQKRHRQEDSLEDLAKPSTTRKPEVTPSCPPFLEAAGVAAVKRLSVPQLYIRLSLRLRPT
ncbi:uncharacterized protein [Dermacentor andersoni]|uniref:uncharacterized protein n=1 Tax=Dermacentor andersoni TaxID=34620 RepID=UPI00241805D6|nr:uncharacterized protein LOC129383260 [Dermacentor andersoni]